MKRYIVGLLFLSIVSCNPIGKEVAEVPLVPNEIVSLKGVELKKGEEIFLWSKASVSEDSNYNIKYSVILNNKIISYDSTSIMRGEHTINSETTSDTGFFSGLFGTEGKSSTEFERENTSIKVLEDGKYDFDFKLYNLEEGSSFGESVALKLRKK